MEIFDDIDKVYTKPHGGFYLNYQLSTVNFKIGGVPK